MYELSLFSSVSNVSHLDLALFDQLIREMELHSLIRSLLPLRNNRGSFANFRDTFATFP